MTYVPTPGDAMAVLQHSSDGVIILDDTTRILYVNAQTERLLRKSAAALEGREFWTIADEARTTVAEETLGRALTRQLAGRFEIFYPSLYVWHAVTVAPTGAGAVLFMRDVTDRMRLLREEAVMQGVADVVSSIPVAVSITRGPEHRFEIVNPAARALLGGRDVVGSTLRNAFPELVEQGFVAIFDEVYASGTPYQAKGVEATFRRGADEELTTSLFDVVYEPVRDMNGAVNGVLSVSIELRKDAIPPGA